MPRFLKNPFAVLLAMWTIAACHATASEGSPRPSIRYVLTQPDGGEDTFWTWPNHHDGTWNKEFGTFGGRGPARGIFAPEMHYLKGKFWLVYSVNHTTPKHSFGIGLACAERPEGPWREMSPERPLTDGFDPNLFEDNDGKVYLLKHGGEISELSADMTRLITLPRRLTAENFPSVGYEGVSLFKHDGRYYLTAAEWNVHADGKQSYDSMASVSTNLFGPYGPRQCALRFGGHNVYFKDTNGNLFATVWCYPDHDPHWQNVSIVPMRIDQDQAKRLIPLPAEDKASSQEPLLDDVSKRGGHQP